MLGAPSGAFLRVNGPQSALESRMSSFIVPLKSGGGFGTAQPDGEDIEEAVDWPEVVTERIGIRPNTDQQSIRFAFMWCPFIFVWR